MLSGLSQPLALLPSQFPKPAVQPASWHTPPMQEAVPLANVHTFPHAPQLETLVRMLASHPLTGLPSQLP